MLPQTWEDPEEKDPNLKDAGVGRLLKSNNIKKYTMLLFLCNLGGVWHFVCGF